MVDKANMLLDCPTPLDVGLDNLEEAKRELAMEAVLRLAAILMVYVRVLSSADDAGSNRSSTELCSLCAGLGVLYWTMACVKHGSQSTIMRRMPNVRTLVETRLSDNDSNEEEQEAADADMSDVLHFCASVCEIAESVEDNRIQARAMLLPVQL